MSSSTKSSSSTLLTRNADVVLFEPMHGAATRVPAGAAAFGRREPCFNASALATWENAATDDQHIAWARRTAALRERYSMTGGGYVNYGAPDEPVDRVRAALWRRDLRAATASEAALRPRQSLSLQSQRTPGRSIGRQLVSVACQTRSPRPQTTSAVGRNVLRDPQVSSNDVKVPNCGGGETLLEPRVPRVAVESHSR